MSRGRKARLTEEKYLEAVRATKGMSDTDIGEYLGLTRQYIFMFRKKEENKGTMIKAQEIIDGFTNIRFDGRFNNVETFMQIPTIEAWMRTQKDRRVRPSGIRSRVVTLFNVCNHLKTHPDKLNLDQVGRLVVLHRDMQEEGLAVPSGLKYLTIRKPLRSFFQLVRGISGELLTSKGIDAGRSKGTGSHSRERVTKEQRSRFERELRNCLNEIYDLRVFEPFKNRDFRITEEVRKETLFDEILGIDQFMYYTATRIGNIRTLEQGTLSIRCNNPKHKLSSNKWEINLMDKGSKGGIEWNKILLDHGIECMKNYVHKRFNIPLEDVETELQMIDSYLFPTLEHNYTVLRKINKEVLRRCGNITKNPNHIWRHTFAQDMLHASDWNYELTAEIGGWKDTGTLKLSYGQMSEDAKERGLMKAMGLEVEDVTYTLRW